MLVGRLALGDVDDGAPQARHIAVGVVVRVAPPLDPADLPVGADQPVLHAVPAALRAHPGHLVQKGGPVVGVDQLRPLVEGGRRTRLQAVEKLEVRVARDPAGGQIEVEGAHSARRHRRRQLLPAVAQGLLGLPPLGEVDGAADETAGQRNGAGEDPPPGTVGPAQPELQLERLSSSDGGAVVGRAPPPVVGMDVVGPAMPQLLIERSAGELQPPLVDEREAAVGAGQPDEDRHGVGHRPERRLQVWVNHPGHTLAPDTHVCSHEGFSVYGPPNFRPFFSRRPAGPSAAWSPTGAACRRGG